MSPVSTRTWQALGSAPSQPSSALAGLLALALLLLGAAPAWATPAAIGASPSAIAHLSQATPTSSLLEATAPALPGPPGSSAAWVAKVLYRTLARTAPSIEAGRALFPVLPFSQWGEPTQLLVLGSRTDPSGRQWLRVRMDYRPNGFAAWIDADDTVLFRDPWRITVSRARRRARVFRDGRLVRTFAVVVGKPSTPTPAGLFAIAAALRQPSPGENFEGSWVLPLTAHSEVLRHFEGGDGQVALHGRGGASLLDPLGSAASHGCVRLADAAIDWLAAHAAIGTPVRIG